MWAASQHRNAKKAQTLTRKTFRKPEPLRKLDSAKFTSYLHFQNEITANQEIESDGDHDVPNAHQITKYALKAEVRGGITRRE